MRSLLAFPANHHAPHPGPPQTDSDNTATDWRAQELLLMREVMKLVGRSLAPKFVLREMLHLMSELLGLNRGRIVLVDGSAPNPVSARPRFTTPMA
ncbi:MAG: hypothetical protein R3E42_10740 [Burkholderiaceae bacterium]